MNVNAFLLLLSVIIGGWAVFAMALYSVIECLGGC